MSTYLKSFGLICFTLILASCGGGAGSSDNAVEDKKIPDYKAYLKEHKSALEAILEKISAIEEVDQPLDLTYTIPEDVAYNFDAVKGTHSGNASVPEEFNSIMISTNSLGKELPEGMDSDYFKSKAYRIVNQLLKSESPAYGDGIPSSDDDRYPSAAIAYMKALEQVEYVFLVDVVDFDKGQIFTFSEELYPPSMKAIMTVFNIKTDEVVTKIDFQIGGYETLYYNYDEDDSYEEKQASADEALKTKNESHFYNETVKLFCGEDEN